MWKKRIIIISVHCKLIHKIKPLISPFHVWTLNIHWKQVQCKPQVKARTLCPLWLAILTYVILYFFSCTIYLPLLYLLFVSIVSLFFSSTSNKPWYVTQSVSRTCEAILWAIDINRLGWRCQVQLYDLLM